MNKFNLSANWKDILCSSYIDTNTMPTYCPSKWSIYGKSTKFKKPLAFVIW